MSNIPTINEFFRRNTKPKNSFINGYGEKVNIDYEIDYEAAMKDMGETMRKESIKLCTENAVLKYDSCGDPMMCGCQGTCENLIAMIDRKSIRDCEKDKKLEIK
jgi:hypothetical protein